MKLEKQPGEIGDAISRAEESAKEEVESGKLDGLLPEADESALWLELLPADCGIRGELIDSLLRETNELLAIFTTIVSKLRKRRN